MSKLSKGELLEWLEDGLATYEKIKKYQGKLDDKEIDKGIQAYNQIMALIQKPEVTKERVEQLAEEMLHEIVDNPNPAHTDRQNAIMFICRILDKIGMKVKK